jgi:hypothetical protein
VPLKLLSIPSFRPSRSIALLGIFYLCQVYVIASWFNPELIGIDKSTRSELIMRVNMLSNVLLAAGLIVIALSFQNLQSRRFGNFDLIIPAILMLPICVSAMMSLKKNDLISFGNPTWITMSVLVFAIWLGLSSAKGAIESLLVLLCIVSITHLLMIYTSQPELVANLSSNGYSLSAIRGGIRALGLTFNAGFLGIAQVVSVCVSVSYLAKVSIKKQFLFRFVAWVNIFFSAVNLYLSGSRLPAVGIALGAIYIVASSRFDWAADRPKIMLTTYFISFISLGFLIPRTVGLVTGSVETANFSGRLDMWQCVLRNVDPYLPFGLGAEAARKAGFCSELDWSQGWRHAESISLTGLVEFGIPGFLIWPIMFGLLVPIAIKSARNGHYAGAAIFVAFVVLGETGGMFVSYLPVSGSSAPRGVFNFYLYVLIWVYVMRYESLSQKTSNGGNKVVNLEQLSSNN